jgi:serine/alanine adding enzyme
MTASIVETSSTSRVRIRVHERLDQTALQRWNDFAAANPDGRFVHRGEWAHVYCEGLRHRPFYLEAQRENQTVGVLPLVLVESLLFGRFLVSSPFVNVGGPLAIDEDATQQLLSKAAELADEQDVKFLELRNTREIEHPRLTAARVDKKIMVRELPPTAEALLKSYKSEFRSKVLRGERNGVVFTFGGVDLLDDFHRVFSVCMRDLGTPVFSKELFRQILTAFPSAAEICLGRLNGEPVSTALIWHGKGTTEVPSSCTIRSFNQTGANMSMYGRLLARAIERGSKQFDFGRSSEGSGTYTFKSNWGAIPTPSVWQYYVRRGSMGDMRPENASFRWKIELWKRMPLWFTRLVGPSIVRGIP